VSILGTCEARNPDYQGTAVPHYRDRRVKPGDDGR
jgi:hypothetical protein